MKRFPVMVSMIASGLLGLASALHAAPTVSNVRASQRADGSGLVDVCYDLSGVSGAAWVTAVFSLDRGASYTVVPSASALSGAVGSVAAGGSDRHIVWNAGVDKAGADTGQARARVSAWSGGTVTTVYLPGGVPLDMVAIPPGSFQMGANENDVGWQGSTEEPEHLVNIAYGFQMGKFEVTQRQWVALMGQPPVAWTCYGTGDDYPAYHISWNDIRGANGFLDKLNAHISLSGQGPANFRLPSEAEWEYACRAGSQWRFCYGNSNCANGSDCTVGRDLGDYAWYCGNYSGGCDTPTFGSKPVGGKLPNAFGLLDMHGNLHEWCEDWYHASYTGAPTDGSAWVSPTGTYRVLRGGAWYYFPGLCRSAYRIPRTPDDRDYGGGFRLSRTQPGVVPRLTDSFSSGSIAAPGSQAGWSSFGFNTSSLGWPDYESSGGAYRAHVAARNGYFRASGVSANPAEWMPYSAVGTGNYARAKSFVYAGGQTNPGVLNEVPNIRVRLQTRFAQNSMLEIFNHYNTDPEGTALSQDFRPSKDPLKPSIYRVDLDPVDVPHLEATSATEGIQRAFEAFSTDPQDNGYVAMTESVLGVYPKSLVPSDAPPVKVYATSGSDAGDLKMVNASERLRYNYIPQMEQGLFGLAETTGAIPAYTEGTDGVTIDCTGVPTEKVGIVSFNINPDRGADDHAGRVRVEPGKQYAIRFHLTATQQSNRQPQIRMRGRSVKFNWTQKFEIGGAWAAGTANNTMAQQLLPGIGCQNPDKTAAENGGWYTLLMHTPMEADIRPDVAGDLATKMPNLSAQPGPGVASPSRRDLLIGIDMIDSLTFNGLQHLEQGQVTLDRIEVRIHDLVSD